jgi:hypothetical protein
MFVRSGILAMIVFLAAIAAPPQSQAATPAGVPFASGGVGADEMQRLKAREKEFNLKLVFTLVEGNYLSDVAVVVKDAAGKPVLTAQAPGPILLAKLARGSYTVDATYEGRTLTRNLKVGDRLHTEYLRWPSNPQTDFPGPKEQ